MRDLSMRGMRRSDVELSVEAKYAPHTRMRRKRDYNCPGRRKKNIVKAKEEKAVKRKSYKWLERSFRSKSVQALCNGAVGDWTTKDNLIICYWTTLLDNLIICCSECDYSFTAHSIRPKSALRGKSDFAHLMAVGRATVRENLR